MKVISPKKKREKRAEIDKKWIYIAFPLLTVIVFLGGMFFYRSGYPSTLLLKIHNLSSADSEFPISDAVSEVRDDLRTELALYQSNGLPTVFLDIPFDSMMQIEEKRDEALGVGILLSSDDDYVPATMHYNDEQTLDVKLRLKGDWVDHLEGDKWSFRIHITEDDGAVLGMRRFSLQAPETRNFVSEWAYHQNLFLEDILTTRYFFLNVVVNGEHKGIYALEESFTEDLLESQNRREGVIIRLDEDQMWANRALFEKDDLFEAAASYIGFFWQTEGAQYNEITPFRGNRIDRNEVLSEELEKAIELLYSFNRGEISANQVLDEKLWGRYYAITDLWAAGHGAIWHNERFYYNPLTGLLEPVAFDGVALSSFYNKNELAFPFSKEVFFNTPGVQKAYLETLERITTPEYIEMLKKEFGDEVGEYYSLLVKEYESKNIPVPPLLKSPWETLSLRSDILSRNLNPAQPIRGNYHLVEEDNTIFVALDLVNTMILPVRINKIAIGNDLIDFQQEWCISVDCLAETVANTDETILLSGRESNFSAVSFLIPIENFEGRDIETESLSLHVNLYGGSEEFEIPLYSNYTPQGIEKGVQPSSTLEEVLAAHPFLMLMGGEQLAIESGDWLVTGDLVLPDGYNLFIPAGTTLRFEKDSIFLIHGKVDIKGTEESPVLLTAENESWGGMVVLGASDVSTWQYAKVEKMAGISRSGWILTGGITFYESAVDISYSVIGNSATEDALNIIRAPFSFDYVEFLNVPSDAFDGDFTTGTASHCSFHDIEGDAFDISGTEATITKSYFVNIGDKAISAGEKSNITLEEITIRNVSIGISSKDLSTVLVNNSTIDSAKVAGLAAYIKKPQYGAAFIEATDVTILNTEILAICQTESELLLNGESIPPEDIDIDSLYKQGIFGN